MLQDPENPQPLNASAPVSGEIIPPPPVSNGRDHVFISYAVENATFAMWLARKLAAEGYLVWCDRLNLLGGQNWQSEINAGITQRSCLMLALMSKVSVIKENPRGEWQMGLTMAKELGRDFVVPLRADGFDPKDLGFIHINRQYIDFSRSWATGYSDLLNTLDALKIPKPRADGRAVSARSFMAEGLVTSKPETLVSNFVRFARTPAHVLQFSSSRRLEDDEYESLKSVWAFRALKKARFLSVAHPPKGSPDVFTTIPSKIEWDQLKPIHQIDPTAFLSEMLRKAASALLIGRGFKLDEDGRSLYLDPAGFEGGWLRYKRHNGSAGRMKVAGKRSFKTGRDQRQVLHYNLGFRIEVERDAIQGWVLIPKLFLRLRDEHGQPLTDKAAFARRKKITRDWWNGKQLATHFAFLAAIQLSQKAADEAGFDPGVALDPTPVTFTATKSLDELRLGARADDEEIEMEVETEIDATDESDDAEGEEVT